VNTPLALALAAALLPSIAVAAPSKGEPAEQDQTLYALGAILGRRVQGFHFTAAELKQVQRGFRDSARGDKLQLDDPDLEEWGPKVDAAMAKRSTPALEAEKAKGRAFAEAAVKEPGAVRTASGLVVQTLKPGEGPSPVITDKVKVHYEGKLIDGTLFDSSRQRGAPAEFRLKDVVPCWGEGVTHMKVGETARLICPADLAYGAQGRPPKIPGGATLVFEIELLGLDK
jgi:FKBP-type peptidyl-prolyl cis-trans isomerase